MIFSLLLLASAVGFRISHLNALLQFKDPASPKSPFFIISADGACVTWTSLDPKIARIIPSFDSLNCSKSARVEVVTTGPKRRTSAIFAESPFGSPLKCDLFIDSIHNVSILTTTRSIYLDSSFEILSLQAADSGNNIFTSLEGLDTKWTIDETHLRTINPEEAKIVLNSTSSVIIQGSKVGRAWATVSINNRYQDKVDLVVVEPIALFPNPVVRTFPHHHIPFKLCATKGAYEDGERKCARRISLPNGNYTVTTANHTCLTADPSGYASTHEEGTSAISVIDQVVSDNHASVLVIVGWPAHVDQPAQYIPLGDDPVFNPAFYDKDGSRIDLFEPIDWQIDGEWKTVGTKNIILSYFDFAFTAVVIVCPPILVDPPSVVLPVGYDGYVIKALGGSGNYSIRLETPNVVQYSNSRVKAIAEGTARILVKDRLIAKYSTFATVIVSQIDSLEMSLTRRELLVDSLFEPNCSVFARDRLRFSVDIPYQLISEDPAVVSSVMRANHPGFAEVFCEANATASNRILVSVADALRAEVPGRGSPFSVIPLSSVGGVLQWNDSLPPLLAVRCPDANVTMTGSRQFTIDREYEGTCSASMQNLPSKLNPVPLKVSANFSLSVSKVAKLVLHVVDDKASNLSECHSPPHNLTERPQSLYRVIPGNVHHLSVFAHDEVNRIVNYYSAVSFDVRTNDSQLLNKVVSLGPQGETLYEFKPENSTDLHLVSPDFGTSIVSLRVIPEFRPPPGQTVYFGANSTYAFNLDGGSGIFSCDSSEVRIGNGVLVAAPKGHGLHSYAIKDECRLTRHFIPLNALTVVSMKIVAPDVMEIDSETPVIVEACYAPNVTIPTDILRFAGLALKPNDISEKTGTNEWKLIPEKVGALTLQATAANGVSTTHVVEIVERLMITPQNITLLPGDTERLTIMDSREDIEFSYADGHIAKVRDFDVVAVHPGKMVINATVRGVSGVSPFRIYVHVLTPRALDLVPSATVVIQNGFLGVNLFVVTEIGPWRPRTISWTVDKFQWTQFNSSFIWVNCSQFGPLRIDAEGYGLKDELTLNVEPELLILSGDHIILPPLSSMPITVAQNLPCEFITLRDDLVTCESDGVVKSDVNLGEGIILVKYGHQTTAVTVSVSEPAFLHVHQISPSLFWLMLLDPYGRAYSATSGINYLVNGSGGFNTSGVNASGYCYAECSTSRVIELKAAAYNSRFRLETEINLSVTLRVVPENPILMTGAHLQLKCTESTANWSLSEKTAARVSVDGIVTARKPGIVRVYCGYAGNTSLTVADLTDVELVNTLGDDYEIRLGFSNGVGFNQNVVLPADLKFTCDWPVVRTCGKVSTVVNASGRYCVLNRTARQNCPAQSRLKVTVASASAKVSKTGDYQVSYYGKTDFGVPNEVRYTVSTTVRKVHVPVIVPSGELKVVSAAKGLTVTFPLEGGLLIRAGKEFKTKGSAVLEHKMTGNTLTVQIVHEARSADSGLLHHRQEFRQDLVFYTCLIVIFLCLFFIIVKVTEFSL